MPINLDLVLHALESVMTYVFIGALGYYLASKGWFSEESSALIARLLTQVTLPIYLLHSMTTILTREDLVSLAYGLPIPFASIIITMGIALLLGKLVRVPRSRKGVFNTTCAFSNTIYIGLPINKALFGPAALPFVLLYYIANSTLFWTAANYQIASDGERERSQTPFWSIATLRKLIPPPMQGMIGGLLLLLLDIRLPRVLANAAESLGSITTPMVIISIGVSLHTLGFGKIRFDKTITAILFSRFIISPLVVIVLCWLFPLPSLMTKVFIIQSSLPVMTSVAMLATFYNVDSEFAAVAVSISTLLSIATIPAFMVLATYLF